jgi:two-component system, OmpR family, KDP operon response regulator KdpE
VKRILAVEDENTMRSFLKASLQAKGYDVFEASDLTEAVQLLKAEKVDLLLLDTDLSDWYFEGQFPVFRANYPKLPVLAMTIGEGALAKAGLLKLGVDDFIAKPFAFPDLLLRIERTLSSPSSECLLSASRSLRVDLPGKKVSLGTTVLTFSNMEWSCLQILCERIGKVIDEELLSQLVSEHGSGGDPHLLLKMTIWQLRQKLEEDPLQPQLIKTVPGIGYRMEMFS